jgi:hypothetical protein
LAKKTRQPRLGIRENKFADEYEQKQHRRYHDDVHVASGHCHVDHSTRQQWANYLDGALDAEQYKRAVHEISVRPCVNKQTTHQPSVVCLAEDIVFVGLGCDGSHSGVS